MTGDPIELQAERLRLLIARLGEEPALPAEEAARLGLAPGGWEHYMSGREPQDFPDLDALAHQCAQVAYDVRERGWAALEFLLNVMSAPDAASPADAAGPSGPDAGSNSPQAAVLVPRAQATAVALVALGWHLPPPDDV